MDKPRFVLSRSRVLEGYNRLRGLCPNISYSMKTNPEVGRVLEEETDCKFGVHTVEGLRDVRDPSRVHFLVQANSRESLSNLLRGGVRSFIVDNEADLGNLLGALGQGKADLFLRMRFQETTVYKGRFFLYGMLPGTINRLIPKLRRNPGIGRLGIHFHRKTQNTGNWSLRYMLGEALSGDTLNSIDTVNIGGGIPVDYKNSRASNLDYIFGKIRELRTWLESRRIEMMMEPGRAIAAPAVRLETCITSLQGRHITVNASVYNSSMDTIIFPLKLLVEGEGEGESYVIKGCTPDSMDIFRYDVRLRNPRVGDMLAFLNAGAYNFSSSFCNLERPGTAVVD
jgi:ornithine decarboxylase